MGKKVHPDVSLVLSPCSSNIMKMISENGALAKFIAAGARLLEAACGPCIGMGQAPKQMVSHLEHLTETSREDVEQ